MGLGILKSVFRPRGAALAASCLFGVLILTHIPQQYMPKPREGSYLDKIEHILAYGAVTLLFLLSLRWPSRPVVLLVILLGLAAVGAVDELTQPWVNRIASVEDFAADLAGIVVVTVVFLLVKRRRRQIENESPATMAAGEAG